MQVYIKKELHFEYAHRLFCYQGKCNNIHGHNQKVWVYFRSTQDKLNDLGMVVDFGDIKNGIGKWIDDNWDHALILNEKDTELVNYLPLHFKQYVMPYNPTAENMAIYLLGTIAPEIYKDSDIEMFKVEVFENDSSVAIAEV
jgi:6-pyruvoyltetrahydropterin/6-carboxytetrahydropterin synthase